jgi:hypothetical protein
MILFVLKLSRCINDPLTMASTRRLCIKIGRKAPEEDKLLTTIKIWHKLELVHK